MVLSATPGSHDGGTIETIDLRYPQSKLVRHIGFDWGDGEVNVLEASRFVQVDVEMLVRIDATQFVEARVPDGATDNEILVIAVPVLRRQQLSVHKVNSDLTHTRLVGHHPETFL